MGEDSQLVREVTRRVRKAGWKGENGGVSRKLEGNWRELAPHQDREVRLDSVVLPRNAEG